MRRDWPRAQDSRNYHFLPKLRSTPGVQVEKTAVRGPDARCLQLAGGLR